MSFSPLSSASDTSTTLSDTSDIYTKLEEWPLSNRLLRSEYTYGDGNVVELDDVKEEAYVRVNRRKSVPDPDFIHKKVSHFHIHYHG